MDNVGNKFKKIYELTNYRKQSDFAKTLGVTKAVLGQWFSGIVQPSPKQLIRLFVVFPEINNK